MPSLCTNCGFNWAHLKSIDGDGEESYEVCPECSTDQYLVGSDSEVAYIKSEISGEITNAITGKPYVYPLEAVKVKPWTGEWEDNYKAKEQREDKAINAYLAATEAGKNGEDAYCKTFNKSK